MIKKLSMLLLVAAITTSAIAQDGQGRGNRMGGVDGRGFQRRTVEERVAMIHKIFDSVYKFDATKQAKIDTAYLAFFKAQDKLRAEVMAGGGPPDDATREQMREKMKELQVARDEKLQEILTEAEYKKFKDEVEPSLMPRRGGQGGFGGRDGERKDGEKKEDKKDGEKKDEVKKEEKKDGEKKEGEEKKEKKKKKKGKKEEAVITTAAQ